jgi:hypothetical protein
MERMREMVLNGSGGGVIINNCYRRTAVLRTLLANFRNSEDEGREDSCRILYFEGEENSRRAEER